MNKIKMSTLLKAAEDCRDILVGDDDKKAQDAMADFEKNWESSLVVLPYRSVEEKAASILQIISGCSAVDGLDYCISLELGTFVYGLLPYIANLDMDVPGANLADPGVYDLFGALGFITYVEKWCLDDFTEFRRMRDDMLNYSNIKNLTDLASQMDGKSLEDVAASVREMKGAMSSEDIRNIAAIVSSADPAWKELKKSIMDQATEAAMGKAINDARPTSEIEAGKKAVQEHKEELAKAKAEVDKKDADLAKRKEANSLHKS
jgi:hypothetical protein